MACVAVSVFVSVTVVGGADAACFCCAVRSDFAASAFERSFRAQTPNAIAMTATAAVAHSHGLCAAEVL